MGRRGAPLSSGVRVADPWRYPLGLAWSPTFIVGFPLHVLGDFPPVPETLVGGSFMPVLSSTQSKRKFERDCREAEKAAQTAERLDQDINATKADVEKVLVRSEAGLGGGAGPEPGSDPCFHIPQAKQQAHLRSHMAEESKNEYAAQLQRFNRDQAHFYFSQMPQIFDVSIQNPQPHLLPKL